MGGEERRKGEERKVKEKRKVKVRECHVDEGMGREGEVGEE